MVISEGGFSTILSEELDIGEIANARFSLLGTGRLTLTAVVRNKNLFRYRCEFMNPSDKVRQQTKQSCEVLPRYKGGSY